MKFKTCNEAYRYGVVSRAFYPLRSGLYKLRESISTIQYYEKEIVRISQLITRTDNASELEHCTKEDKALWLKELPLNVSYLMGYEIIPALRALEADGVNRKTVEATANVIELSIDGRLACWDGLRNTYNRRIAYEYELMGKGKSNAMAVVKDALGLIDHAVSLLPANIQREI